MCFCVCECACVQCTYMYVCVCVRACMCIVCACVYACVLCGGLSSEEGVWVKTKRSVFVSIFHPVIDKCRIHEIKLSFP